MKHNGILCSSREYPIYSWGEGEGFVWPKQFQQNVNVWSLIGISRGVGWNTWTNCIYGHKNCLQTNYRYKIINYKLLYLQSSSLFNQSPLLLRSHQHLGLLKDEDLLVVNYMANQIKNCCYLVLCCMISMDKNIQSIYFDKTLTHASRLSKRHKGEIHLW